MEPSAAYWAKESTNWPHRRSVWLSIGSIPEGFGGSECPMILDWNPNDLGCTDRLKWPPTNAVLSDLVEYSENADELSSGERSRGWPLVTQMQRHFYSIYS